MNRSTQALAACLLTLVAACAADAIPGELDTHLEPDAGAANFAGSAPVVAGNGAMAGAAAIVEPAAGTHAPEVPAAGSSAAGSSAEQLAGSGGGGAAAGAGGGGSNAAGSGGQAGGQGDSGGAGGSVSPPCPDADADGTCDANDKCPVGSDVDADKNGYPDACETKLWELPQRAMYTERTYNAITGIMFDVYSTFDCGAVHGSAGASAWVKWDASLTDGITVNQLATKSYGNGKLPEAVDGCTEFTPRVTLATPMPGQSKTFAAKHIVYFRFTGTVRFVSRKPDYDLDADVVWTAYGY